MHQRPLDHELGLPIGVDRLLRVRFRDRHLDRLAVGRASRREDEVAPLLRRHRLEHAERADDIVAVIARRIAHRFANVEKRGEVHDREDVVAAQRAPHGRHIRDVALDQLAILDGLAVTGDEVVEDDDAMTGLMQRLGGMAADVAGAAGDENAPRVSGQWRNR